METDLIKSHDTSKEPVKEIPEPLSKGDKIRESIRPLRTGNLLRKNLKFLVMGILFGIILTKSEAISWFRMQEMFRLQGFQMYGIFMTAIPVGIISILIIKRFRVRTIHHEAIYIPEKKFNKGYIIGGFIFGLGWALTGACPGPLFAQIGAGFTVIIVTLLSAILGTWVYSALRDKLPH